MATIVNQDLTQASRPAPRPACPETAWPEAATPNEPAPGGGLLQVGAGNPNPSARVSKNVAEPPQKARVRRKMKMGSSVR